MKEYSISVTPICHCSVYNSATEVGACDLATGIPPAMPTHAQTYWPNWYHSLPQRAGRCINSVIVQPTSKLVQ